MNSIQKDILSKARFFKDGAKYAELKDADIDNDLHNYHLQQLVKTGYLEKDGKLYKLTEKGKSYITNVDSLDKKRIGNYKVSVYMCVVDGDRVLVHRRLKQPQYGYVGFPSGKISFGEGILETGSRELFEETHLKAEFKIIGNLRQIRHNAQGDVIEDGVFYVLYSDNFTGKLLEKQLEGENFWVPIKEALNIEKLFKPSFEIILNEILDRRNGKKSWDEKFIYELTPPVEEY